MAAERPASQEGRARRALDRIGGGVPLVVQFGLVGACGTLGMIACSGWGSDALAPALLAFLGLCAVMVLRWRRAAALVAQRLDALCQGELAHDARSDGRDEFAALGQRAQRLAAQLSQVVASVRNESQFVSQDADVSARQADELARRTASQAASLEQTRARVGTLLESVRCNAEQVRAANDFGTRVDADVQGGQAAVLASVDRMRRIEARSQQMGEIVATIDSIAFQTNILALNAAVEAARAGEQGRGFAVVAGEVRALSLRSTQAASEVKQLIHASIEEVAQGVQAVLSSRETLARAVEGIREVAQRLGSAAQASGEQSLGLQEVAQAIEQLDEIAQRNGQMVEKTAHAAERLHARAQRMGDSVRNVRLRQGCADEARAMAERAAQLVDRVGPEAAVRHFHDPNGEFRDRDLYIVAADRDDVFRAFGSDPSKVGKRRSEALPGDDQTAIREASWRAADAGGGWIEFVARHPVTKLPVPKMGYIAPAMGGRWVVQCSVNRSDGTLDGNSHWLVAAHAAPVAAPAAAPSGVGARGQWARAKARAPAPV